jgi:hypothetical protein
MATYCVFIFTIFKYIFTYIKVYIKYQNFLFIYLFYITKKQKSYILIVNIIINKQKLGHLRIL